MSGKEPERYSRRDFLFKFLPGLGFMLTGVGCARTTEKKINLTQANFFELGRAFYTEFVSLKKSGFLLEITNKSTEEVDEMLVIINSKEPFSRNPVSREELNEGVERENNRRFLFLLPEVDIATEKDLFLDKFNQRAKLMRITFHERETHDEGETTLFDLAFQLGVDVQEMTEANNLSQDAVINDGQELKLPTEKGFTLPNLPQEARGSRFFPNAWGEDRNIDEIHWGGPGQGPDPSRIPQIQGFREGRRTLTTANFEEYSKVISVENNLVKVERDGLILWGYEVVVIAEPVLVMVEAGYWRFEGEKKFT